MKKGKVVCVCKFSTILYVYSPRLLCLLGTHFLESYFEIIVLDWICSVQCGHWNVEHFEGRWVWLSFNINFYKDETPLAPPSVHHCLYHIWCTQGPGWLGLVPTEKWSGFKFCLTFFYNMNTKNSKASYRIHFYSTTLHGSHAQLCGPASAQKSCLHPKNEEIRNTRLNVVFASLVFVLCSYLDGGEPVGNGDGCSAQFGPAKGFLHYFLTLCIQGRGGLQYKQNRLLAYQLNEQRSLKNGTNY